MDQEVSMKNGDSIGEYILPVPPDVWRLNSLYRQHGQRSQCSYLIRYISNGVFD